MKKYILLCAVLVLFVSQAKANPTVMPWEGPLQKILASLSGPVAKSLGAIAIIIAGLGIAYGEAGSGIRRLFQVVLGLSIALTASSLVVTLFGLSGAPVT